jgi:hypothetical protein
MAADYTLLEVRKRNGVKLVIRLRTYKGTSFVDLLEYFLG